VKFSILILIIIVSLVSCMQHSGPNQKIEYVNITKIKELEGVYSDKGDPNSFLSDFIWRYGEALTFNYRKIPYPWINVIEISTVEKKILLRGYRINKKNKLCGIFFYREYIDGRNFEIVNGKILFDEKMSATVRNDEDDVVAIGPYYQDEMLGLDCNGHLVWKRGEYGAVLFLFIFPVAGSVVEEIRFEKLDAKILDICN